MNFFRYEDAIQANKINNFLLANVGNFLLLQNFLLFLRWSCNEQETFWTEISKNASVLLKNFVTIT